jgi:hypothetical protein
MSIVVEAIESVVDAVDTYIVQPILDDPLTFVATMAAATFAGPGAFGITGLGYGAAGMGVAAGAANTAAGLLQGEDFDEAIKGGAIAGLTTWGAASLSGTGGSQPTSEASALQKGISSTADKLGDVGLQSADEILGSVAKQPISPLSDVASFGANYGDELGQNLGKSALDISDDILRNGPLPPNNPFAPTSVTAPPASTTTPPTTPSPGAGVYTGSNLGANTAVDFLDEAAGVAGSQMPGSGLKPPVGYDLLNPATNPVPPVGLTPSQTTINQFGPQIEMLDDVVKPQSMLDKALGYGKDAVSWAVSNPQYSIPLALGAASLLSQDKPDDQPSGSGSQGQIGSPDFYEPLDLYRMNRNQLGYQGDIYSYGTQGGEHDFFSPTVYEPIRYAEGGNVQPARDEYGYYTYGQIPRTMRKFAKGGLSALATQGNFDGRSDDIPAVLSDGEFVIDAETVALLGNGSSKAGANKLEQMRQAVRKQKGGALSQGKFSPDAKSPLEYLKSSKRGRG